MKSRTLWGLIAILCFTVSTIGFLYPQTLGTYSSFIPKDIQIKYVLSMAVWITFGVMAIVSIYYCAVAPSVTQQTSITSWSRNGEAKEIT